MYCDTLICIWDPFGYIAELHQQSRSLWAPSLRREGSSCYIHCAGTYFHMWRSIKAIDWPQFIRGKAIIYIHFSRFLPEQRSGPPPYRMCVARNWVIRPKGWLSGGLCLSPRKARHDPSWRIVRMFARYWLSRIQSITLPWWWFNHPICRFESDFKTFRRCRGFSFLVRIANEESSGFRIGRPLSNRYIHTTHVYSVFQLFVSNKKKALSLS